MKFIGKTQAEVDEEAHARAIEECRLKRFMAYRDEADPLFFKWQRGESTQEEWLAKIEEIRERIK